MAKSTWNDRDLPVLEEIVEAEGKDSLYTGQIATNLGLSQSDVNIALRALLEADYITFATVGSLRGSATPVLLQPRPLESGRRATQQWPTTDPYADLLALLSHRISETADEQERSRLERLRDAIEGMGVSVATSVLTDLVRSVLSGGVKF